MRHLKMALIKLIPVLITLGVLCDRALGEELTTQRVKRSLTTICVEIKPSGPLEEPYYMCKGTDLPPLVPKDTGNSYKPNNPSYGGNSFQNPSAAYNAPYQQGSEAESYGKQPANNNQNNGPGYGGFRRPPPSSNSAQQTDSLPKQQFFPKPTEFQQQQSYEQQPKVAPSAQPAAGYGFPSGKQQASSFTPSNSPYVSESGATQAQPAYGGESGSESPSGGAGTFMQRQSNGAASYGTSGSGTEQHSPSGASGPYAKSAFSKSLPASSAAQTSFGQALPYASAAAASPNVAEHGYAEKSTPSAFMVPTAQKLHPTHLKLKNTAASAYGADEQLKSDPNSEAAALYQPAAPIPNDDYRSMLSEDIFQSPVWGFSPDEFASMRSISDESEQPLKTSNGARSQQADSFLRHMPPEYRDDPVMRQFYKSLHEPMLASNPLLTMPVAARPYNSKYAKVPQAPARPRPAPLKQPNQPAVINTKALCENAAPTPPPPRKQPQQCSATDYTAAAPYAPPTRLTPPANCEPCNRRDYNFQPVFIALPCYGQQSGFVVPPAQSSYPSQMNQYAPNLPSEAAYFGAGFGPGAYGMPYIATNLGSTNPFAFYNNQQYPAANRASSAEQNAGRQPTNNARKPTLSNERNFNAASLESTEYSPVDAAKSTEATNNDFTSNTSMETAETKSTQPAEPTTSVTEATATTTGPEIQNKPPAPNARANESSQPATEPTTEAMPMEEETRKTYDSIMSLAQQFSRLNQDEFIDIDFDDDDEPQQSKSKRLNKRQQGAVYKRQYAPAI